MDVNADGDLHTVSPGLDERAATDEGEQSEGELCPKGQLMDRRASARRTDPRDGLNGNELTTARRDAGAIAAARKVRTSLGTRRDARAVPADEMVNDRANQPKDPLTISASSAVHRDRTVMKVRKAPIHAAKRTCRALRKTVLKSRQFGLESQRPSDGPNGAEEKEAEAVLVLLRRIAGVVVELVDAATGSAR